MSNFGEELKRERELREITLREVSEATKINLRYLEAMESNEFEHLPGGLFNRGFVRAYAQFIGVDPEDMVNAYLMEEQQQSSDRNGPDRRLLRGGRRKQKVLPGSETKPTPAGSGWRLWVLVAIVLLIVAGAYAAYRWLTPGESSASSTQRTSVHTNLAIHDG